MVEELLVGQVQRERYVRLVSALVLAHRLQRVSQRFEAADQLIRAQVVADRPTTRRIRYLRHGSNLTVSPKQFTVGPLRGHNLSYCAAIPVLTDGQKQSTVKCPLFC